MSSEKSWRYALIKSKREWVLPMGETELWGNYIALDELKRQHPDGRYIVVGEVLFDHTVQRKNARMIQVNDELELPVDPPGTHSGKGSTAVGYIPCENGEYILLCKKSRKQLYLIVFLLLLIALLLAAMLMLYRNAEQNRQAASTAKLEIDPSITEYQGELKRPPDMETTQILIPGFEALYLQAGSTHVDTVLFNPEDNPCYFQFNIKSRDTDEVFYESKLVPPGKGIEGIELNRTFKAGEYPAVIQFRTHDLEDPTINYNGSDMEIMIIVQ